MVSGVRRKDVPYSRTDIICIELRLRGSERGHGGKGIDQPVVFKPSFIDLDVPFSYSGIPADQIRSGNEQRISFGQIGNRVPVICFFC